ncbi:hypothetical protein ARMGADRAFT_165576 [Armillaria gallica]|uniref:Uncharacterized protein n=1 Tax=Armillaria gallica TaxID=47427 RepID=A0A2H3DBF9_ARMGA|nr:hypothetical protein ARMGADRAFT_165576 [Armillaria gallica]
MFLCQSQHIYPRNRSTGADRNQCDMYSWSRTEYYYGQIPFALEILALRYRPLELRHHSHHPQNV